VLREGQVGGGKEKDLKDQRDLNDEEIRLGGEAGGPIGDVVTWR